LPRILTKGKKLGKGTFGEFQVISTQTNTEMRGGGKEEGGKNGPKAEKGKGCKEERETQNMSARGRERNPNPRIRLATLGRMGGRLVNST